MMIASHQNFVSRIATSNRLRALALAMIAVTSLTMSQTLAQEQAFRPQYQPKNRNLIRGDMAPGIAADISRMSNPKLEGHVQPVRVVAPVGARVQVSTQQGYISTNSSRTSVGLQIGPVYRFKVTDIPRFYGKELYPSVEVLNRLSPPNGLENEFPIQVVMTQDDLEQALNGRMVTKVVYLENPETALPHLHKENEQPYFDVGGGQDPLRAAEKLGRPMAILRIGSRIPMPTDMNQFGFNAPSPTMLPDPQAVQRQSDWEAIPRKDSPPSIPGMLLPIPNGQR